MIEAVLTIDDIASENTRAMVDFLCVRQIPAVMFAVGCNVEKFYDNAVYAVEKGILVGNHSYSHRGFSSLFMEEAKEEITKTEGILEKVYADAGVERKYKVFRFPYGDKGGEHKEELQAYLKENGFAKMDDSFISYDWYLGGGLHEDVDTFWTFDFGEWQIREGSGYGKEEIIAKMEEKKPGAGAPLLVEGSKHILLLHAHDETESMLPEYYKIFLEYAMERGVKFRTPEVS